MKSWLTKHSYYLLLAAAMVTAAYGFWQWRTDPYLVGTVVAEFRTVGAREGGTVREVNVAIGDRVVAGQVVAWLDDADLRAEKKLLREELASLEEIMAADRRRFDLEYDFLRLRVSEQYAEVQADLAELNALRREIGSLIEAEEAGLGHGRDLTRMIIRRDALQRSVTGHSALIRPEFDRRHDAGSDAGADSILTSLLGDRTERIHETLRALMLTDQRLLYRTIRAPCDGLVVEILALAGSTVDAFAPIITVEDTRVSFVEVYVPETQDRRVDVGQAVEVYSRRSDQFDTTGRIDFVHPGYSPMPERLWLRGQMLWARKLRVTLASGHSLLPGESVRVRILQPKPGGMEAAGRYGDQGDAT